MDLVSFDLNYRKQGYRTIAGVDEAGRGPLAGPVVAAAVILPQNLRIKGLKDSKKLTAKKREEIFIIIERKAERIGLGVMDQRVIDSVNILQATYLAMKQALSGMNSDLVLVDGWKIPDFTREQRGIIGGDNKSASIAAASVVAKVTRDRMMVKLSGEYPLYNFHKHKGYGTREHVEALRRFGPCPLHRKSFAPVRECSGELQGNGTE
jgi:ribonuclease HII